jgi:hypothetical protein
MPLDSMPKEIGNGLLIRHDESASLSGSTIFSSGSSTAERRLDQPQTMGQRHTGGPWSASIAAMQSPLKR